MEGEQTPSGGEALENDTSSPVEKPPLASEREGGEGDKVAYASYQKLLSEKKKLQARVDKIEREAESRQKEEMEAQQRYKELWESEKTATEELKSKVKSYEDRWDDAIKLDAFNRALGDTRRIDPKYSGFIDTSKILIDPESGKIDDLSARREVERVSSLYPEIVKSTVTTHLPNETPTPGKALSREEWLKLPPKEMAARMKEVMRR